MRFFHESFIEASHIKAVTDALLYIVLKCYFLTLRLLPQLLFAPIGKVKRTTGGTTVLSKVPLQLGSLVMPLIKSDDSL